MTDADIYPVESDRRRFVKGVVGASSLAALGATGAAAVSLSTTPTGVGGGITQFMGIDLVGGPAPRGMPQIPVEVDDEGYLVGIWPEVQEVEVEGQTVQIAEMELGGITYSASWYNYCGGQTKEGTHPTADQENYIHYATAMYDWQAETVSTGDRVHIDHFDDYEEWNNNIGSPGIGKPGRCRWRSEDVGPADVLPVQVIRSSIIEEAAEDDEWLAASTDEGFLAIANMCTHFCCVPSFKGTRESEQFGTGDEIYCQCHQSVYDPFNIYQQQFVALPRQDI